MSLEDGCISGLCAEGVDADTRERFANDPLNLLATSASANRSKGPRAADEWPGDTEIGRAVTKTGHCVLVVRQIAVKTSYELTVTAAERKAMTSVLSGCSDTTMPTPAETDVPAPSR